MSARSDQGRGLREHAAPREHSTSSRRSWPVLLAAAAVVTLSGCGAGREHSEADDAGIADEGGDGDGAGLCEADATIGHRMLRRLTRTEYEASVRLAFELDEDAWPGSSLLPDASVDGYNTNAEALTVDEDYAAALLASAELIAETIVEPARLVELLPCADQGQDQACAEDFLAIHGRRLYRRPLTEAERSAYLGLFDEVMAEADFRTAIEIMTIALLDSPNFVYRSELGEASGDHYELDAYELATAIAFTYTGAGPSDELLDLAAAGELDAPEGLVAAVEGLVFDPDSGAVRPAIEARLYAFVDQWLGLAQLRNMQKDEMIVPGFTPEIRDAMIAETHALFAEVVLRGEGGVSDLLTAPFTVLDEELATYYGWGSAGAGQSQTVERPADWGVGLLAQGSISSVTSNNRSTSPTMRGLLVREKLLCFRPPPPPPGVADIPPPTHEMTTRERYELHTSDEACAGCHDFMDPIGFGFEHLDAGGRYRELDSEMAIDASGTVFATSAGDLEFTGQAELAEALAELADPGECVAAHMAGFSFGVGTDEGRCLAGAGAVALGAGEIGVLQYWMGLAETEHVRMRR